MHLKSAITHIILYEKKYLFYLEQGEPLFMLKYYAMPLLYVYFKSFDTVVGL
jgi:hypothetical protein